MAIFDPADYFAFAQQIVSNSPSEAGQRAAISRAYYACHLTARDQLYGIDGSGLTNPVKKKLKSGNSEHRAVYLTISSNPYLSIGRRKRLSDELGQLKDMRETADYYRDPTGPNVTNTFAKNQVNDWSGLTAAAMALASNLLPELRQLRA